MPVLTVLITCKFDEDQIKTEGVSVETLVSCKIFVNQGQVTLKCMVPSGLKSNTFEILCLSWLPASLTRI